MAGRTGGGAPIGNYLNFLGESGTEHHGLTDTFRRHCILLHNASDLWLKTHVQHAVSLIQDQVAVETHHN